MVSGEFWGSIVQREVGDGIPCVNVSALCVWCVLEFTIHNRVNTFLNYFQLFEDVQLYIFMNSFSLTDLFIASWFEFSVFLPPGESVLSME